MTIWLQVCLIAGSLLTFFYMQRQIKRSKMQIDYTIFWTLFTLGLLVLGIFPGIASWLAAFFGFQSPANLVYLLVIFVLLMKEFTDTAKLSKLNHQVEELTQYIALQKAEPSENAPKNNLTKTEK